MFPRPMRTSLIPNIHEIGGFGKAVQLALGGSVASINYNAVFIGAPGFAGSANDFYVIQICFPHYITVRSDLGTGNTSDSNPNCENTDSNSHRRRQKSRFHTVSIYFKLFNFCKTVKQVKIEAFNVVKLCKFVKYKSTKV